MMVKRMGGLNITIPIENGFYELDNEKATIIKNYCLQFGDNYNEDGIPNGFSLTINGLSITKLLIRTSNGYVNISGTNDENSLEFVIGSDGYNYVIINN